MRQNGYRLANRVTHVCGAAHFSQSDSTLMLGDTGLNLNVWQRVSRQRAGCKSVCSGGTSSDSTAIQETVFYNFDLTCHPCCPLSPSPPPYIPRDE